MSHSTRTDALRQNATAFLRKHGFYVVMGLCMLCAGIALAVRLLPRKTTPQAEENPSPIAAPADNRSDERFAAAVSPTPPPETAAMLAGQTTAAQATAPPEPKPTAAAKTPPITYSAPVRGAVVWGYAIDTLLYSQTLDQWTTHAGVDIAAKLHTEVRAIKDGTVSSVSNDKLLGTLVMITHDDHMVSVYANLQENPPVKEGQRLLGGDILGLIGNTAVSECALEPHLHFALYVNDKPVDPHEHIVLGK